MTASSPVARLLAALDPATLRELASLLEERRPLRSIADPEQAAAELAEMLGRGATPTIGWWRRHLAGPGRPASYRGARVSVTRRTP